MHYFKKSDTKVLFENFVSLSSLQLFSTILPLIVLPYVIRILGFELYGVLMTANAFVVYFQSLTDYSFRITATRDVSFFKNNIMKLSILYSSVMYIKFAFFILSGIIITITIFAYKPFSEQWIIYSLTSLYLSGNLLFPDWFFQGIEKMKYISIVNISIKLLFTVLVFFFIKTKADYWIYPLLQSMGVIVAGFWGQLIIFRKYKIRLVYVKISSLRRIIKQNFPIFINQFFPNLYNNTSTFLLGLLALPAHVGIFTAIKKVVDFCVTLMNIISRVFFPFFSRNRLEGFKKFSQLYYLLTIILFTTIILLYRLVFLYLNIENTFENILILSTLALGLFGIATYEVFGLNYFIIKRKDKLVMKNTVIWSITGLILSFPLIYFLNSLGAAINLSISRWLLGAGLFYKYKKQKKSCY